MEKSDTDRNLLFGLLRFRTGWSTRFSLWPRFNRGRCREDRPLADHFVERGALDAAQRGVIEAMVGLHLKKHGGSTEQSLAGIPATILSTQRSLAGLARPGLSGDEVAARVVHLLGLGASGQVDPRSERIRDFALADSADDAGTTTGEGTEMRTVISHVALHDPESSERPLAVNRGNGERRRRLGRTI